MKKAKAFADESGSKLVLTSDVESIGQQDAIYTDTWVSMGDEDPSKKAALLEKFAPYQVNHKMMEKSGASIVMHCQPAHLEEEITTALFDSEMSVVFQEAGISSSPSSTTRLRCWLSTNRTSATSRQAR